MSNLNLRVKRLEVSIPRYAVMKVVYQNDDGSYRDSIGNEIYQSGESYYYHNRSVFFDANSNDDRLLLVTYQ